MQATLQCVKFILSFFSFLLITKLRISILFSLKLLIEIFLKQLQLKRRYKQPLKLFPSAHFGYQRRMYIKKVQLNRDPQDVEWSNAQLRVESIFKEKQPFPSPWMCNVRPQKTPTTWTYHKWVISIKVLPFNLKVLVLRWHYLMIVYQMTKVSFI